MPVPEDLLAIMACPACHGALEDRGEALACHRLRPALPGARRDPDHAPRGGLPARRGSPAVTSMRDLIGTLPAQLRWAAALEPPAVAPAAEALVAGMGGSGIAGSIAGVVADGRRPPGGGAPLLRPARLGGCGPAAGGDRLRTAATPRRRSRRSKKPGASASIGRR